METCKINGCDRVAKNLGMCGMHYKRQHKYGDASIVKRVRRIDKNARCLVDGCHLKVIAKGLCTNHYALARRNGTPVRTKIFTGVYIKDGYRYVMVGKRHYEPEHRLVMEKFLGRKLRSDQHVHHIDEDTLNNSPNNLVVLTRAEHMAIHRLKINRAGGLAKRGRPRSRRMES